jgi:drug/metabolite transporter (DMT)-like permease
MSPKTLAALLALGGVWGASFLFIKLVVEETSPLQLVAGRLFLGAAAVVIVMVLSEISLSNKSAAFGQGYLDGGTQQRCTLRPYRLG